MLLRNVLERRRELALLGAVGYRRWHIFTIVMAETTFSACDGTGGRRGVRSRGHRTRRDRARRTNTGRRQVWLLLLAILVIGLLSSVVAARTTLRSRLLSALRAE